MSAINMSATSSSDGLCSSLASSRINPDMTTVNSPLGARTPNSVTAPESEPLQNYKTQSMEIVAKQGVRLTRRKGKIGVISVNE